MFSSLTFCCLLILTCTVMSEGATRKPKRQPAAESSTAAKPDAEPTEAPAPDPKTLDRGWGSEIVWYQTYEEALAMSRETRKPLMVIHHLEDCPFSQDLKKAFVAEARVQKLAQENFIMFNVMHPVNDENQSPDGNYVPRILFVDPSMTVRTDLAGRYANKMYAYEAGDMPELLTNMKKALTLLHTEL